MASENSKKKPVKKAAPKKPTKTTAVVIHKARSVEDEVRAMYAKQLNESQVIVFSQVAKNLKLDIYRKQISPTIRSVKTKMPDGSVQYIPTLVPVVTVDGYRAIAFRSKRHAGTDDAIFEYDAAGKPVKATVTVYAIVGKEKCAFTASARMSEYIVNDSHFWTGKPHIMLAKCAECLALRKAFPEELGGTYYEGEVMQTQEETARDEVVAYDDDAVIALIEACKTQAEYDVIKNDLNAMKYRIQDKKKITDAAMKKLSSFTGKPQTPPKGYDVGVGVGSVTTTVLTDKEKQEIKEREAAEFKASQSSLPLK